MDNPGFEDNENNATKKPEEKKIDQEKLASYEDVVKYLGFGKFNMLLVIVSMPITWAVTFESTTFSYIFTSAKCDLNISMEDTGLLNGISYTGRASSCIFWGYLGDTLGRKQTIVIGMLLTVLFDILGALGQNITWLLICKFFGGFMTNGPFMIIIAYLSEFHSSKYRAMVPLCIGFSAACSWVILPLLGWTVLIKNTWEFEISSSFRLHSWNFFLLLSSIPALISIPIFFLLPETPKFLMSTGRNKEAMKIFLKMYTINTGKSAITFPFKKLVDEKKSKDHSNRTRLEILRDGLKQIKPLFKWNLMKQLILIWVLTMFASVCQLVTRMWAPQMLQSYEIYKENHNESTSNFCDALDALKNDYNKISFESNETCVKQNEHSSVYLDTLIIGAFNVGSFVVFAIVLKITGKKKLLRIIQTVAAGAAIGMYFASNQLTLMCLLMTSISIHTCSAQMIANFAVEIFPTTLRVSAISIVLMMTNAGTAGGSSIFPQLLLGGCVLPFSVICALCIAIVILSFFLPTMDNLALQ